jgi:hypothetical protein
MAELVDLHLVRRGVQAGNAHGPAAAAVLGRVDEDKNLVPHAIPHEIVSGRERARCAIPCQKQAPLGASHPKRRVKVGVLEGATRSRGSVFVVGAGLGALDVDPVNVDRILIRDPRAHPEEHVEKARDLGGKNPGGEVGGSEPVAHDDNDESVTVAAGVANFSGRDGAGSGQGAAASQARQGERLLRRLKMREGPDPARPRAQPPAPSDQTNAAGRAASSGPATRTTNAPSGMTCSSCDSGRGPSPRITRPLKGTVTGCGEQNAPHRVVPFEIVLEFENCVPRPGVRIALVSGGIWATRWRYNPFGS